MAGSLGTTISGGVPHIGSRTTEGGALERRWAGSEGWPGASAGRASRRLGQEFLQERFDDHPLDRLSVSQCHDRTGLVNQAL